MRVASCFLMLSAFALVGCDQFSKPSKPTIPVGRYAVAYSRMTARDTFLIDTTTGKTWQLVEDKDHRELWQQMTRTDGNEFPANDTEFDNSSE